MSWGFNEIVTGFYSGTCAMLDQDPDALIGIAEKMNADDFAVAPMPVGPNGKSYPTSVTPAGRCSPIPRPRTKPGS